MIGGDLAAERWGEELLTSDDCDDDFACFFLLFALGVSVCAKRTCIPDDLIPTLASLSH